MARVTGARFILGPDDNDTGEWTVTDLERLGTAPLASATEPRVYWPASYWPEVEQLVRFSEERRRLGLCTLEGALMH